MVAQDEEEKVVGRDHRAKPDHQDRQGEQQPAVGDAVAYAAKQRAAKLLPTDAQNGGRL